MLIAPYMECDQMSLLWVGNCATTVTARHGYRQPLVMRIRTTNMIGTAVKAGRMMAG